MEGYTVISSKKVSLYDIEYQQDQRVESTEYPELEEIPSSPIIFEVVEKLSNEISCENNYTSNNNNKSSPSDDEIEIISCGNDSNDSHDVEQHPTPSNNFFDSSTASFDGQNSLQFNTHSKDCNLYAEQNDQMNTEVSVDGYELFTIDFLPSSEDGHDISSADDSTEDVNMCSESDGVSGIYDAPVIGLRRSKVPANDSIEQYIVYNCPQCGIECGPMAKWKLHTESKHGFGLLEMTNFETIVNNDGKQCHQCRDCHKTYPISTRFSHLFLHRITHLPFKNYFVCQICSIQYAKKGTLARHLVNDHNLKSTFEIPDSALEHIRYFCPICNNQRSDHCDWRNHMEKEHNYSNMARSKYELDVNGTLVCNVCQLKVSRYHLLEHMQLHESFKSFECTNCKESFSQLKTAARHVRYKHLRAPAMSVFKCTLCKAKFETHRERCEHYRMKHKIIYQTCKVCRREFESASSLLAHMTTKNHHTAKPKI